MGITTSLRGILSYFGQRVFTENYMQLYAF